MSDDDLFAEPKTEVQEPGTADEVPHMNGETSSTTSAEKTEAATAEISLDDDDNQSLIPATATLQITTPPLTATNTTPAVVTPPPAEMSIHPPILTTTSSGSGSSRTMGESNAASGSDAKSVQSCEVSVVTSEKRGEGMNSYIAYKVITDVKNIPAFPKSHLEVWRRFSDFLGLHEKLMAKHLHNGRIVPPAPEKNVLGTTKTKIAKELDDDTETMEFVARRRASLERYLRRTVMHPILLQDPDVRDFLILETELPRSNNTASLSGAGIKRLVEKVGDSINRATFRMDETDQWFEDRYTELESYDDALRKLHAALESLVYYRKELCTSTDAYCKSMYMLSAAEDNTALSRALSQLAETQEKVASVHQKQRDKDFFMLTELVGDYVSMVGTVKAVLHERVKVWQVWQNAQTTLNRKRENKARMELAGRTDRLPMCKKECDEAEARVLECQDQFEAISKMIRKEYRAYDLQRIHDFKHAIAQYMESLALSQQQIVKYWEAFLPEANYST